MALKTKQIIYELDELEENDSPKKGKKEKVTSQILERKLGIATYVKWGAVHNYHFSFDLNKGRLLCYKQQTSNHPKTYYTLIAGSFMEDEEEISKREKLYSKKKNYIAPPAQDDPTRSVIYVKTKKGKGFRLLVNEGESTDKIMGYLQMCFTSKANTDAKAFYAMLGVGVIKIHSKGYKLNTGILVPLNNWDVGSNGQQNYLKSPDVTKGEQAGKISQLVNNIPVIGALVSAFEAKMLSLIFNPNLQTIDAITYDSSNQPSLFLYQIFQLVKKSKRNTSLHETQLQGQLQQLQSYQQNEQHGFMKLNTTIQISKDHGEMELVAENKHVQIYCKKCYLPVLNQNEIQASMMASKIAEDQLNNQAPDDEKDLILPALNFYKKALSYHPNSSVDQTDHTKEFILITQFKLQDFPLEQLESPKKDLLQMDVQQIPDDIITHGEYQVNEEIPGDDQGSIIQRAKVININMNRSKVSSILQSPRQFSQTSPFTQEKQQYFGYEFEEAKITQFEPQLEKVEKNQNRLEQKEQVQQSQPNQNMKQEEKKQMEIPIIVQQQIVEEDDDIDDGEENMNPENLDAAITKAGNDTFPTSTLKGYKNIIKYVQDFKPLTQRDEFRVNIAHKNGGTACLDKKIVELSRSVGKTMIKEIGKKIIGGDFNLTTVSFPIKAMIPKSALEKTFMQTLLFPLYLNRAATISDPVERLKLLMVAIIGNYIQANTFLKPLNPIVGETFEASYEDGSQLYAEQISHHPPVSYFLFFGPQKSYKFWGYYLYEAKAGLNSLTLTNKGKRYIEFYDGQKISFDFNQEAYSGTFFGTMKHESTGKIQLKDEKNGFVGTINFGKVKKRPTDYVDGDIKKDKPANSKEKDQILAKLYGSYMGFLEWDNKRYWDAREILPFKIHVDQSQLESDHTKRSDRLMMIKGDMKQAQDLKVNLEGLQRTDTKLRKEFEKQKLSEEKKDKKKKK